MDFKSMLQQLSQLSEATEKTATGVKHKAEPGGYGRKFDTDEEGDEKKDDKKKSEPAAKRGRGRPKKGADDSGEVKKYDNAKNLQSFMIGNVPKKSKELEKLPKKKHSLKEWVEEIESMYISEAEQVTIQPAQQNTQVIKQGTKTLGTVNNPQLAAQIKQSIGKGEMSLAGDHKLGEADEDYSAKKARAGKDIGKPGKAFGKIAKDAGQRYGSKAAGERVAGAVLAKLRKGVNEAERPSDDADMGAGLGAGRSQATLEAKEDKKAMKKDHKAEKEGKKVTKDMEKVEEAAKPDYIDLDKDGNKKESMKKAAADKKKKVNESMHKHTAAKLMGKAHALAKEGYNCKFEDMAEARAYHDGFKEGLDECYGMMPVQGLVVGESPAATVLGMASQAMPTMEDDMEEGNAFTAALAKTPKGGKFSVGGKTFTDRSDYSSKIDEFTFESWDNELNSLLTEGEQVDEGMSVSISKGQQGSPDSVSVTAQDGEAEQLLGLLKQAGLGLFGGEEQNGYGAPQGEMPQHGGVDVVGDHDGMMALIKKVTGGDADNGDYADEEGEDSHNHGHEHEEANEETCNECGAMESSCECEKEMVDEVESEDQMAYEVAEDNAPDSDEAETTADENAEAEEDKALAMKSMSESTKLDEWANDAGKKGTDAAFTRDIEFMTKIIAGGLNKPKSTGQTTIPVVASQEARLGDEDVSAWKKLAGIGK
jgi:hypothetical protein